MKPMGPLGNRDERLFEELRHVVRVTREPDPPRSLLDSPGAIPGYELLEELHRGGQGIVYRALQKAAGREVALKVLLRGRDASARDRVRFEREVELVSRLRHPGIVTLHDSGVADGRPYLVMEFVPGRRLDVYVQKAAPKLDEALRLFQRMRDENDGDPFAFQPLHEIEKVVLFLGRQSCRGFIENDSLRIVVHRAGDFDHLLLPGAEA